MNTKEIQPFHNHLVQGIQEDFKQNDGQNPNHTSSPTDAQRKYCAKLDWWVDAVAVAKILRKIWLHSIYKYLLQNIIIKYFTLLRWVG